MYFECTNSLHTVLVVVLGSPTFSRVLLYLVFSMLPVQNFRLHIRECVQLVLRLTCMLLVLQIGDIPDADLKPPENVLFVCKLNPVTNADDLKIIFSRFGKIIR